MLGWFTRCFFLVKNLEVSLSCISYQLIETLHLTLKLDAMSSIGSDRALLAPDMQSTSQSFGFLENLEHLLLASIFFPKTQDENGTLQMLLWQSDNVGTPW